MFESPVWQIGGRGLFAPLAVTAARTMDAAADVWLADATAAAFTLTLPEARPAAGMVYHIKKTDSSANAVTIDGDGAETIDGALTYALAAQYDAVQIHSDGTEWHILATK